MSVIIHNKIAVCEDVIDASVNYTPLNKYELPGPRKESIMHFVFGGKVFASIYTLPTSIVSDFGVNINCKMEKNKLIINNKWKGGEKLAMFYIAINNRPVKAEAVKITYDTGLPATITIGNIKFRLFVVYNTHKQIEYRFDGVCRGVGNLSVYSLEEYIVFYLPRSPDLKELYNELSYVSISEYSDVLFATYRRTKGDYGIYLPKGGLTWTKKTSKYAIFNGEKTFYIIVGVGDDGSAVGEFVEVPS